MKLEDVSRDYNKASRFYDPLTSFFFHYLLRVERYRRSTIDMLGDLRGKRVLDIGCGTGRNLPILAPRVGESGSVVALDYSEGMLEKAAARVAGAGWNNVALVQGDAATLDAVEPPFDAVLSVWCLGIVYDLGQALQNAVSVLRPGGRLAIMDFQRSKPDTGLLRRLYPLYSRVLQITGIDSAEDLDDQRLARRWASGRRWLEDNLDDIQFRRYLSGMGFVFTGRRRWPSTEIERRFRCVIRHRLRPFHDADFVKRDPQTPRGFGYCRTPLQVREPAGRGLRHVRHQQIGEALTKCRGILAPAAPNPAFKGLCLLRSRSALLCEFPPR